MLNLCGIVVAILKMATGRNFSMSNFYCLPFSKCITKIQHCPISSKFGMWVDNVNSGHHYLPTYQIVMISDNVEFCGIVVAILRCPELIHDIK
jgi:hypothetical protein